MDYFIPILFLSLNHCLFSVFTSGNESIEDDALVELAKGPEYFNRFCADKGLIINEKNQFVSDKYEAHLGILYMMRMEWDFVIETEHNKQILNELEKFRQFSFILYEYFFWQYVAEYVKAEQISILKNPIKPKLQSKWTETITLCEAIEDWALVWKNAILGGDFCQMTYLINKQTLIDEYGLNLNKWYTQHSLFDMHKLKLSANSQFDKSFASLRTMFDFNMEKLKSIAVKKACIIPIIDTIGARPREALTWHIEETPFYGIDKAIKDNVFLIVLKEMRAEKFGAKLETAPLNANAKTFIQTKEPLIRGFLKIIYLMRMKWQCAEIENYRKECIIFRKYFNFLYEYLFRVYNEEDKPKMPKQFAAVRPNFIVRRAKEIRSLTEATTLLAAILRHSFLIQLTQKKNLITTWANFSTNGGSQNY